MDVAALGCCVFGPVWMAGLWHDRPPWPTSFDVGSKPVPVCKPGQPLPANLGGKRSNRTMVSANQHTGQVCKEHVRRRKLRAGQVPRTCYLHPLTCIVQSFFRKMVGDTGIEPVTPAMSKSNGLKGHHRFSPEVQVSRPVTTDFHTLNRR